MRILAIIPARGGSKGVPRKNIRLLGGKPLLQYTAEIALSSKHLDKVILSSDDNEIINIGKELGLEVPFKRPAVLAEDKSSSLSVIEHALEFFKAKGEVYDAVCLLQVTCPFRTVTFLDVAIEKFKSSETDSLVSVLEVPHEYNPHWTFKTNDLGNLRLATGEKEIISRRQELPKAYHRDGSIYITKSKVLLEKKSLYGNSIAYIESAKEDYVNIDTMEDWKKAELMAENRNE